MKGKKQPLEARKKISAKLMGEKSPNWKGGIAKYNKKTYRNTLEKRLWLEACMKRDDYTCLVCLSRGVRLEIHHIKTWSEYPELRYEVSNGITLCKSCHRMTFKKETLTEAFFIKLLALPKINRLKELSSICSPKKGMNSGNL